MHAPPVHGLKHNLRDLQAEHLLPISIGSAPSAKARLAAAILIGEDHIKQSLISAIGRARPCPIVPAQPWLLSNGIPVHASQESNYAGWAHLRDREISLLIAERLQPLHYRHIKSASQRI